MIKSLDQEEEEWGSIGLNTISKYNFFRIGWIQYPMTLTHIMLTLENLLNSQNRMPYNDNEKIGEKRHTMYI